MNLYKIQHEEQQQRVNEFLSKYAFFAFNEEQFQEGLKKLHIEPGAEKVLVRVFAGCFILRARADEFKQLMRNLAAKRKAAIEDPETGRQFAYDMFIYELANHEYTYTGDEFETLEALGYDLEDVESNHNLKWALHKAEAVLLNKEDPPEPWKVFYNRTTDKEYTAYTIRGTFDGEQAATRELIANEHGITPEEIEIKIEVR